MTIANKDTQKAQHMIKAYNFYKNNGENLYQIYKNYSYKKEKALSYCKELKTSYNGFGACFCGHNSDIFTYAFLFKDDDKTYLMYITPTYNYCIEYE